jgi:cobalt/nickel transport system permease protein
VLLVLLIVLATAHRNIFLVAGILLTLLACGFVFARVPLVQAVSRAAVVLPFTLVFAAGLWLSGDPHRGIVLVTKAYVSALAVLLAVATTPLPLLVRGMESVGAPRLLLTVAQFVYRYLFVIAEEAQHMSRAAAARGATLRGLLAGRARFRAAAGALAVLFVRSYGRAEEVHKAILARGFSGKFETLEKLHFGLADAGFLALASALIVVVRVL